jgi:hypothetical protein
MPELALIRAPEKRSLKQQVSKALIVHLSAVQGSPDLLMQFCRPRMSPDFPFDGRQFGSALRVSRPSHSFCLKGGLFNQIVIIKPIITFNFVVLNTIIESTINPGDRERSLRSAHE